MSTRNAPLRARRVRRGFNLVELLISLSITAALLTATLMALDASFMAYQTTTELASTHTVSRLAMHRMLALIRTGQEFGPFPANPLDSTVESDEIQFLTAAGDVMILRWIETDAVLQDNSLYIVLGGEEYLLLEGVVAQYDPPTSTNPADRIAPFTLEFAGIGIKHSCVTEIIQCEVGVRHFLFELRPMRDQFDQALRQNKAIVPKTEHVFQKCIFLTHFHRQIFSTPSGIS